tara:strand:- start:371 stop:805 length:435 start_codon:yes stop_codon:yes gene_type:complete
MQYEKSKNETEKGLWDRLVNNKFDGKQPILSEVDSLYAARKLYRKAMGKAWRGEFKLTSGNRYTWIRRGVFYVNPDKREGPFANSVRGLRAIIHDVSHICHYRLRPKDAAHSKHQAYLERDLTDYAISQNLFLQRKVILENKDG